MDYVLVKLYHLVWSDVDLDKKIIHVNQTLVYVDNKIIFKDPKTPKSKRKLFTPDELISLLEEEKLKQNKLKLQGILKNEFDLICLNKRFNQWVQPTFVVHFKKLLRDNNPRDIKVHELIHANATLILLSSTNIKAIYKILVHADIKIAMNRYSIFSLIRWNG